MNPGEHIISILEKSFRAFVTFIKDLHEIRRERDAIIREAIREAEQKKIEILKSKINTFD